MKKINKKLLIIIVIILVLFFLLLFIFLKPNKKSKLNTKNQYVVSDTPKEFSDTTTIKNDLLTTGHCLDDICVSNVTIYDNPTDGRIVYTITNKGSNTVSNTLKMNFGSSYTFVSYSDLEAGKSITSSVQYHKISYAGVKDFSLEYLSDEERSKIVYR